MPGRLWEEPNGGGMNGDGRIRRLLCLSDSQEFGTNLYKTLRKNLQRNSNVTRSRTYLSNPKPERTTGGSGRGGARRDQTCVSAPTAFKALVDARSHKSATPISFLPHPFGSLPRLYYNAVILYAVLYYTILYYTILQHKITNCDALYYNYYATL